MLTEKQLTNKILSNLKSRSDLFLYKRFATGNEAGKPDLTGVYLLPNQGSKIGLRLEIEVKAPRLLTPDLRALESAPELFFESSFRLASKRQQYWLRKFKSYGCLTGVVLDVTHIDLLLSLIESKI